MSRKILVEFSGENYALAMGEMAAVSATLGWSMPDDVEPGVAQIVVDKPACAAEKLMSRLGLAHRSLELFETGFLEERARVLADAAGELSQALSGKNYAIRAHRLHGGTKGPHLEEIKRELGSMITGSKVNLREPEEIIDIWVGEKMHVGLSHGMVQRRELESRKVDRRPFFSPVSIHPKLARAILNLSRVGDGEVAYDPFCGTGGILIEAALMGLNPMGSDIRREMVEGTRKNMDHFGVEGELFIHDINNPLDPDVVVDVLVTDPPYGRATKTVGAKTSGLIEACFSRAEELLERGRRMVIVIPDFLQAKQDFEGMVLMERYEHYVHGSLTRQFCVYEKS
ncbi:MAG: methyltransferase [Candidatus Thermoplasmatota archaeon]|nr:methyltransferase [Candidatus Thermoplasmatota archaeon]